jgi:hypothetical protein
MTNISRGLLGVTFPRVRPDPTKAAAMPDEPAPIYSLRRGWRDGVPTPAIQSSAPALK